MIDLGMGYSSRRIVTMPESRSCSTTKRPNILDFSKSDLPASAAVSNPQKAAKLDGNLAEALAISTPWKSAASSPSPTTTRARRADAVADTNKQRG